MVLVVRNEGVLVLWCSSATELDAHILTFQKLLVAYVWKCASDTSRNPSLHAPSTLALTLPAASVVSSKPSKKLGAKFASLWRKDPTTEFNEKETVQDEQVTEARRSCRYRDVYTGAAIAIDILICTFAVNGFLRESLIDGSWTRMLTCAALPFVVSPLEIR